MYISKQRSLMVSSISIKSVDKLIFSRCVISRFSDLRGCTSECIRNESQCNSGLFVSPSISGKRCSETSLAANV